MTSTDLKEKFSFNLQKPEERVFNVTVLYITYKTIEANNSITINQLRWLLNTEYMLSGQVVDGAIASLTSKALFNCVSRWTPPRNPETIHLRARKEALEFKAWFDKAVVEHPELLIFRAPNFLGKSAACAVT